MARVVLARPARAELDRLAAPLVEAVDSALSLLAREPYAGHALRGRLGGLRAVRIGAYRILYELRDQGRTVRVLAIRHREVAYRRDPR